MRRAPRRQHDDLQAVGQREGLGRPALDREQLGAAPRQRGEQHRAGDRPPSTAAAAAVSQARTQKMPSSRPRLRRSMVGVAPAGGLAGGLGVAQALLFLGRIDDDARRRLVLPEDQAVDEGLVAVGDGARCRWLTRLRMLGSTPLPAGLGDQRLLGRGAGARRRGAGAGLRCARPASRGDSASLAWSAGVTSCGRGSPGRGGRSSALGGMVSGECETILNSSGDTFLPPPRFSRAPQPPSARAPERQRLIGIGSSVASFVLRALALSD